VTIAILVGVLFAGGAYLVMQRSLVRLVFGIALLGHGTNFAILSGGGLARRAEPFPDRVPFSEAADPLPQAFVLTAIVITFAVTVVLLGLAVIGHNDDTHRPPATGEDHDQ
jgi:multicomponent Na+:H+ antiporter subunit C